jgi:hypothetical protein
VIFRLLILIDRNNIFRVIQNHLLKIPIYPKFVKNIHSIRRKKAARSHPLAAPFLDTKIPQGVILPAAWICKAKIKVKIN